MIGSSANRERRRDRRCLTRDHGPQRQPDGREERDCRDQANSDSKTSPTGSAPYRTVTRMTVATSGGMPATRTVITVVVTHFESQIEARVTGFEATHASVPDSRSRASRLPATKIVASTKIWAEKAGRVVDRIHRAEVLRPDGPVRQGCGDPVGDPAVGGGRQHEQRADDRMTQARRPRIQSVVSLRATARKRPTGRTRTGRTPFLRRR